MPTFELQFPLKEVRRWAAHYGDPSGDDAVLAVAKAGRRQGYLTGEQFRAIAGWKSKRPAKRHASNAEETVREVTRFAFGTPVEALRLRALTLLEGVQCRTASAILHLCHRDPYPLMDERAFHSLGVVKLPSDWESFWPDYVATCRDLAQRAGVDLRTLDRALWGFDKARAQAR